MYLYIWMGEMECAISNFNLLDSCTQIEEENRNETGTERHEAGEKERHIEIAKTYTSARNSYIYSSFYVYIHYTLLRLRFCPTSITPNPQLHSLNLERNGDLIKRMEISFVQRK